MIVVCPVANLFVQDRVYAFSLWGKVDRIPARRLGEVQRSKKLDKLWPLLIIELIVPKATNSINVFSRKVSIESMYGKPGALLEHFNVAGMVLDNKRLR